MNTPPAARWPADEAPHRSLMQVLQASAAPLDDGSVSGEIGRLLTGWEGGTREVRIGLREALLPDTTVRIFESQGQLRVELTVGSPTLAAWLASRLPVIVRDLGQELDRPMGIWVLASSGEVVGSDFWPRGTR